VESELYGAEMAARKLMERGAKSVVITLGGNGSLIVTDKIVRVEK
jgi:fructose-1-phosphate kinase PfkB-like protein